MIMLLNHAIKSKYHTFHCIETSFKFHMHQTLLLLMIFLTYICCVNIYRVNTTSQVELVGLETVNIFVFLHSTFAV